MLQLAPATRGSSNAAASRATAVGSNTVSASTVSSRSPRGKPRRGIDRRAAAAARAVADHHVDQALRAGPLRDSAGVVGGAVIDDDDFDRPQGLPVQRGDRGAEARAAVERRDDHADRDVAGWRLAVSPRHAKQGERNKRQRVAGNVEDQHREGEQEPMGLRRAAAPFRTCEPPRKEPESAPDARHRTPQQLAEKRRAAFPRSYLVSFPLRRLFAITVAPIDRTRRSLQGDGNECTLGEYFHCKSANFRKPFETTTARD